jgi:type I restriction enzyme R subunit
MIRSGECAFYDARADNESAVQAMGSQELRVIATELVTNVRNSVTIDWTLRESAREDQSDGETHSQKTRLPT